MRLVKIGMIVLLVGCVASTHWEFARYAERTEIRKNFELKSAKMQTIDSLEISIDYMPQEMLDKYFLNLNTTSISESQIGVVQEFPNAARELEKIWRQNRRMATEKLAGGQRLPASIISQLESAVGITGPAHIINGSSNEKPCIGGSATLGSGRTMDEARLNPYALYDVSDIVRLDVFKVNISNYSSEVKELNTKDIYLTDELGNQQNPIEIDFFETLYLKAPAESQKPARYANMQRTLLASSPVFPGQQRKAFLAFYAIPEDAKDARISWRTNKHNGIVQTWDFSQTQAINHDRYICIPVIVKTEVSGPNAPGASGLVYSPLEDVMVFSDPPGVGDIKTNSDGWAILYINTKNIENNIFVYAIGAENPEGNHCKVYFGTEEIVFDSVRYESISSHYEVLSIEEYKIEI